MCEYCQNGKPLTLIDGNGNGISIIRPNILVSYYNEYKDTTDGLFVKIKYCPMCGMKIEPYKPKLELDY